MTIDTILDTPLTSGTLTIGSISIPTVGTIDVLPMLGSSNQSSDHDWFKITLLAGQEYVFGAAVTSGLSTEYLGNAAIDLRDSTGTLISGTFEDSVAPTFTYTPTISGTYFLAISAGTDDTESDPPYFDYQISVLQNLTDAGTGVVDPFIPYTDTTSGITPSDIVAAAKLYVGKLWAWDNCTGLTWAIATEAGGEFYETINTATDGRDTTIPSIVPDPGKGYVIPTSGVNYGNWTTFTSSNWTSDVQVGDLVRIPKGVVSELPEGHSFVVVDQDSSGDWEVIDNTDPHHISGLPDSDAPITISEHTFNTGSPTYNDILHASTAYISRLNTTLTEPKSTLPVSTGGIATISHNFLWSYDKDNLTGAYGDPADITYTVTAPAHGTLLLNGVAANTFTQADIDNGLVQYRQSGDMASSDEFTFTVSDPAGHQITEPYEVAIVNTTAPVIEAKNTLGALPGSSATIWTNSLCTVALGCEPTEMIYKVLAGATHGMLLVNGTPADSFTQSQIDDHQVEYRPIGDSATGDRFTFQVTDAAGDQTPAEVFTIDLSAGAPPITTAPAASTTFQDVSETPLAVYNQGALLSSGGSGSSTLGLSTLGATTTLMSNIRPLDANAVAALHPS